MKRLFLFFATAILALLPLDAQETIMLKTGADLSSTNDLVSMPQRSIEEDSSGLTVTYTFTSVARHEDPLYPNHYLWSMPGFGKCGESGKPAILLRTDLINVPGNMSATISIIDASYVEYKDSLAPAREPLSDDNYDSYTRDNVKPIKPFSGFYPKSIVEATNMTSYRGNQMLPVEIHPIQYSYSKGTVRVYTMLKFRVNFNQKSTAVKAPTKQSFSLADQILRNATINNKPLAVTDVATEDTMDYLIITTSDFIQSAKRFAELKKLMGFNIHIMCRDDWTPEILSLSIKNYYATHPNLYYFVIIGDDQHVPAQKLNYLYSYLSDRPYGCMSDFHQKIPDLMRGRISVATPEEADIVVDKIINYELNPVRDSKFYSTGLNCAYFQDNNKDGVADRRFAETAEEILVYLEKYQNIKLNRVYYTKPDVNPLSWNNESFSFGTIFPDYLRKPGFAWDGDSEDILRYINAGANLVLHRDHGSSSSWVDPSFLSSDIYRLSNGKLQPIVFSLNCETGMMNCTGGSFAEVFLRHEKGGCVGIIAATKTSFSGYNDAFGCGIYDAIWPEPGLIPRIPSPNQTFTELEKPIYQLGGVLDQGLFRMSETYGMNDAIAIYTSEIFHCFGDPSMEIYNGCPTEFSNVNISRNGRVDVSVPNEQDVRITFIDNYSGEVKSFLGNAAYYLCDNPENITVSIRAHNKIPFIDYGETSIEYIQNEIVSGIKTYSSGKIRIGSKVTDSKPMGHVNFKNGDITLKAKEVVISGETAIEKGTIFNIESR